MNKMGYYTKYYKVNLSEEKLYYEMFFEHNKKILDIGCATGNFLAIDKKNIIGVEKDVGSIKIAKSRGLKVIKVDVENKKLPFHDNSFDFVNARHILEHTYGPLHLLQESRRVLKIGGKLVLTTEDARQMKWKFYDGFEHVKPYTPISLMKGALDAGFKKYDIFYLPTGFPFLGILYNKKIIDGKTVLNIQRILGKLIKIQLIMIAEK